LVNCLGSFALGLLLGASLVGRPPAAAVLGTGFCGGFTTFSTFSWEAIGHVNAGRSRMALAYGALTLAAGLGAMILGRAITSAFSA
jgi:CrcB protein